MRLLLDLFLILGGVSLSVGIFSLLVGILIRISRVYFSFGVFSIGAGMYYLLFYWGYPPEDSPSLHRLLISAAAIYYISFPLFISEYTGSRKKMIPLLLGLAIFAGYITYLLTDLHSNSITWQVIVHTASLGIGIYGIFMGFRHYRSSPLSGLVFTISMVFFFFLLINEIVVTYSGLEVIPNIGNTFMPLDLYPVLFILIMSAVLGQDLAVKYQLQKQLIENEKKWSAMMDNVRLIVMELKLDGEIEYINPYYEILTGYTHREAIGKNWFELMLSKEERNNLQNIYKQELENDAWPEYRNQILTKNGKKLMINWSNLPVRDKNGEIRGVLSIGFDQTQQEERISEIKQLKKQLEKENLMLQEEISRRSGGLDIIGESNSIKYTINKALQVAPIDSTVLLEGETGVGKELFADLVQSRSTRHNRPYLKINCAAIPRELIESELFGHKKGSFTGAIANKKGLFEMANGGTLFLDEISAMPVDLQSKLLRVLQGGEFHPVGGEESIRVNVRIIAATNENLKAMSESGKFRNDLYYRLNVYPITIPPLRQRSEDIPLLVSHFTRIIGKRLGKNIGKVSIADLEKLTSYAWPGNVRELENWVERAIISSQGENLEFVFEQLPEPSVSNGDQSMEEIQRKVILDTLEECDWKINGSDGAANRLRMHPSTLRSKMKKLDINRPN